MYCDIDYFCHLRVSFALIDGVYLLLFRYLCVWNVDWHIVFVFNCVCRLRLQIVLSILMAIWIAFMYCDIECVCRLRVSFALIDGVYLMLYPLHFWGAWVEC